MEIVLKRKFDNYLFFVDDSKLGYPRVDVSGFKREVSSFWLDRRVSVLAGDLISILILKAIECNFPLWSRRCWLLRIWEHSVVWEYLYFCLLGYSVVPAQRIAYRALEGKVLGSIPSVGTVFASFSLSVSDHQSMSTGKKRAKPYHSTVSDDRNEWR